MSPELPDHTELPGSNAPTASLTDVKVGRRRNPLSTRKRGDLTAAADSDPAEAASEPKPREVVPHIELFHQRQLAGPADPPREADPIEHEPLPEPLAESIEPEIELADELVELAAEDPPQLALPAPSPMPPASPAPPSLYVVPSDSVLEVVEPEIAEPPKVEPRRVEHLRDYAASEDARARSDDEIIDYWDSLRGEAAMPRASDLDRDWVGRCWPNSLVLAVGEAETTSPRIARLGQPRDDVEFTPMVIEWILARGRQSARRGMPIEEEQRFPVSRGSARYRLILLPLGNGAGRSSHVLCRICPTQDISAAAAFKRWLAS